MKWRFRLTTKGFVHNYEATKVCEVSFQNKTIHLANGDTLQIHIPILSVTKWQRRQLINDILEYFVEVKNNSKC